MKKTLTISMCTALFLTGCTTTNQTLNDNIGKIGGTTAGATIGAAIGKQISGDSGMLVGALIGGTFGYLIGDEIDTRREALAKIAKEEQFKVISQDIEIKDNDTKSNGDLFIVESRDTYLEKNPVELKEKTKTVYKKFANEYKSTNKKLLIVSHTDDSGNSISNQKVTEKRAKEIANIFKDTGISEDNIYFLGAGDSQPIADNKTKDGKIKNNRIEIVELTSEDQILKYSNNKTIEPKYISPTTKKPIHTKVLIENFIDFKGIKVQNNKLANNKKFGAQVSDDSFSFVTKAFATNKVEDSYFNCLHDKPRISGETFSLKDNKSVDKISEYKKGMYGTTWFGNIDNNLVGVFPIKVLRDGLKVKENPKVAIYKNYIVGTNKKADNKIKTQVNTYQGSSGILYRIFADDQNTPFQCMDIVFDEIDLSKSVANIYYTKNNSNYTREFSVNQLQKKEQ